MVTLKKKFVVGYKDDVKNMQIQLTAEQIKNVMDNHFNMNCDFGCMSFNSLKMASAHYTSEHNNKYGYVRCCDIKLRTNPHVMDHIQWHINPDTFRYVPVNKHLNYKQTFKFFYVSTAYIFML